MQVFLLSQKVARQHSCDRKSLWENGVHSHERRVNREIFDKT